MCSTEILHIYFYILWVFPLSEGDPYKKASVTSSSNPTWLQTFLSAMIGLKDNN